MLLRTRKKVVVVLLQIIRPITALPWRGGGKPQKTSVRISGVLTYRVRINYRRIFAKPYFHKYWTEIHDVTTIWKRNVCSCIVTLNAFDVRPQSGTSHKICFRGFGGNGSIAWTSAVSHVGRTSNAFKVTMKLQTFLFQMVVTSCISVQYLWKYGFAKSSDNLYAPCRFEQGTFRKKIYKHKWFESTQQVLTVLL